MKSYVTRSEIIVKGKVQKAAFRSYVKNLAKEHKLFGFVKNLSNYDEDVYIMCEGEKERITAFKADLEKLKRNENKRKKAEQIQKLTDSELMIVQVADVLEKSTQTGERIYDNFIIIREPDESGERFDEGAQQIKMLRLETNNNLVFLKENYDKISSNMHSAATAITLLLASTITALDNTLKEDRKAIAELTMDVKKLVDKVIKSG